MKEHQSSLRPVKQEPPCSSPLLPCLLYFRTLILPGGLEEKEPRKEETLCSHTFITHRLPTCSSLAIELWGLGNRMGLSILISGLRHCPVTQHDCRTFYYWRKIMELHEFLSRVRKEFSSMSTFEKDNRNKNNVALYLHLKILALSKFLSPALPWNLWLLQNQRVPHLTAEFS